MLLAIVKPSNCLGRLTVTSRQGQRSKVKWVSRLSIGDQLRAMAETTMDAIKKKMQAMRLEKETAFDRADQLEQRLTEQKYIYDKVSHSQSLCVVAITDDCCYIVITTGSAIRGDSARRRSLRRSSHPRSPILAPLKARTNLHPTPHHFQVTVYCWSYFCFRPGGGGTSWVYRTISHLWKIAKSWSLPSHFTHITLFPN